MAARRAAPLTIFVLALLVRVVTAWPLRQPGYMDAYYYYHVADSLYHGKGFVEEFVWNWLSIPDSLPQPSNVYWMPLISVLGYLSFLVFGEGFRAAQVPSILLSSLFPVLAYWVGLDIFRRARYAWAMALLTTFSGVGILYWVIPDNFGPFAVVGFLSLVFTYKGLRDSPWYHLAAGAMAGLAYLSRPDGALFLVTQIACVAFWRIGLPDVQRENADRAAGPREARGAGWAAGVWEGPGTAGGTPAVPGKHIPCSGPNVHPTRELRWSRQVAFVAGSAVLFALTIAPWLYRNQTAFGALLPPGGAKTLFLTDYNDIFAYGKDLSLNLYLDWGVANILWSKLAGSAENTLLVGELMLFYMVPFAFAGFWSLRRRLEYLPFFVHAVLLFAVMSWAFTFPGPRGSFLHSSVALLPFVYGAALVGLDRAIVAAAKRLRHWQVEQAQRNFTVLMVLFALLTSAGLAVRGAVSWDERFMRYQELAEWLRPRTSGDELIMVVDPPGYYYSSGRRSIVATNDDLTTTLKVARRYDVRYIVVEPAHPLPWHQWYLGKEDQAELIPRATFKEMKVFEISPPAKR